MSDRPSSACLTSFSCEILWKDISHAWKRAGVGKEERGGNLHRGHSHLRLLKLAPDRTVGKVMNRLAKKVKSYAI